MKGVAAKKPFSPEGQAFRETVFPDGFRGVGRARRIIPAPITQERGYHPLVNPDQRQGDGFHQADRSPATLSRAEKNSEAVSGPESAASSQRAIKIMSMGFLIRALFRRKSALNRLFILFLTTALPTFPLTTTAIRENSREFGRKTM